MALITKYPSLSESLVLTHKSITRGLSTTISRGNEYLRNGLPEQPLWQGYLDFVNCLVTLLTNHHLTEDGIIFPSFAPKMPDVPYARLMSDHKKITSFLESIGPKLTDLIAKSDSEDLQSILKFWQEIFSLWTPHIQVEEQAFAEDVLTVTVNLPEQNRIMGAIGKYNQEHGVPPELIMPFFLFNLDEPDRRLMSAMVPQTVLEELIPKVWKDRWAPMKPFLLS